MFSFFGMGTTNYSQTADKLLIKVDDSITILKSIVDSNNKNVTSLRTKFNMADNNLKSIKTQVDKLEQQFRKTISDKNPSINKLPISAKNYISSNGTKYIIHTLPTIKYMQKILTNFKSLRTADNAVKAKTAANAKAINNARAKADANAKAVSNAAKAKADANAKAVSNAAAASAKVISNAAEINRIKKGASSMLNSAAITRRRINVARTVSSVLGTKPVLELQPISKGPNTPNYGGL
jgi:hypothetical protein